jgi:PPM family protein phosphatase
MELRGATATHVGNVRENNQDRGHFGGYVAVVADGMGGHQGGETAAAIAISEFVGITSPIGPSGLVELVEDANRAVFERAAEPDLRGMGTTLVALTLRPAESKISVVNVGDSRAYFVRGNELGRLTNDHSLVEDLVRQKRLTPDEAAHHPQRNILTRALGIASHVEVDQFLIPTKLGDRFLLCSDGLFNEVAEHDILRLLMENPSPLDAAESLVSAALSGAGRDNITVVVVDVVDDGEGGSLSPPTVETVVLPPAGSLTVQVDHTVVADAANGSFGSGGVAASGFEAQTAPVAPLQRAAGTVLELEAAAPTGLLQPEAVGAYVGVATLDLDQQSELPIGQPRRLRRAFRLVVLGMALGALVAGGYLGVQWYGRLGWYVQKAESGQVAVFHGRPDGFLWTDPIQEPDPGPLLEELIPDDQAMFAAGPRKFDSQIKARAFLDSLRPAKEMVEPTVPALNNVETATTTTTTTATTGPAGEPATTAEANPAAPSGGTGGGAPANLLPPGAASSTTPAGN